MELNRCPIGMDSVHGRRLDRWVDFSGRAERDEEELEEQTSTLCVYKAGAGASTSTSSQFVAAAREDNVELLDETLQLVAAREAESN